MLFLTGTDLELSSAKLLGVISVPIKGQYHELYEVDGTLSDDRIMYGFGIGSCGGELLHSSVKTLALLYSVYSRSQTHTIQAF